MEQRAKKAATKAVMARRPIQHPLYALENIKDVSGPETSTLWLCNSSVKQ